MPGWAVGCEGAGGPDPARDNGIGLAKNHPFIDPFIDGNKRVAFQVMYAFLRMNGLRITASEPDVVALMLSVAGGELDEQRLVEWIRSNTEGR